MGDNWVSVRGIEDFDLERIFECGQCFRWERNQDGSYTGVANGIAATVKRELDGSICISGTQEEYDRIWRDYFDIERDYEKIRETLCIDEFMQTATEYGAGIRILKQDKWEALCSFIISQCNNIPRIKKIISVLCREYGDEIEYRGGEYYTFPRAERIAGLDENDLSNLRCGYRSEYIIGAARAVADGAIDLEELSKGGEKEALKTLKQLRGVGDKVANCVVLFGLHILDAFPIDVWMKRAMREHYGEGFDHRVFSPYAGIAQQYIFYYTRSRGNTNDESG